MKKKQSKKERIKDLENELERSKKIEKSSDEARQTFSELYLSGSKLNDFTQKENNNLKQQIIKLSNKLDEAQNSKSDSRLINTFCGVISDNFEEYKLVYLNESLNVVFEELSEFSVSDFGDLENFKESLSVISKFNGLLSRSIAHEFYDLQGENEKLAPEAIKQSEAQLQRTENN